jgi:hypothetical protein
MTVALPLMEANGFMSKEEVMYNSFCTVVSGCVRRHRAPRLAAHPSKVCPFLVAIPNLFLGREPEKIGSLVTIIVSIQKFGDNGNPGLIGAVSLEKDTIANGALECAQACANNIAMCLVARYGGIRGGSRSVDPFPREIVIPEFIIRVIPGDSGHVTGSCLPWLSADHIHGVPQVPQMPGSREIPLRFKAAYIRSHSNSV